MLKYKKNINKSKVTYKDSGVDIDQGNRLKDLKDRDGIGLCNITKGCTEVCPEGIPITDNAIIPLKERVVDEYYDPLVWIWKKLTGKSD